MDGENQIVSDNIRSSHCQQATPIVADMADNEEAENVADDVQNVPAHHNAGNGGGAARAPAFLSGIKPPAPLSLDRKGVVERWTLWKQQWEHYEIISRLNTEAVEYQKAMFLNSIGVDALKVYNGFVFADNEVRDIATIIRKFDTHIVGQVNETYERYIFNGRNQQDGEAFDDYLTDLRNLAKSCNFCACLRDSLLRDRIVMGIRSNEIRRKLLEIPELTLEQCINTVRINKDSGDRAKAMSGEVTDEVHAVRKSGPSKSKKQKNVTSHPNQKKSKTCKFCKQSHPFEKGACPAWGSKCDNCGGRNHFAVVCKKKKKGKVHAVYEEDSESDYEHIATVTTEDVYSVHDKSEKQIFAKMLVDLKPVKFQIDSGASVNLIPRNLAGDVEITPTEKALLMWNSTEMKPLGTAQIKLINPATEKKYKVAFTVVEEDLMPILGLSASQKMGIITVNNENFAKVSKVDQVVQDPIKKFKAVFGPDLGNLPGTAHLKVDKTVPPVVSPARRVPIALRPLLKKELERLTKEKVIAPVSQPTDWVSSLVTATKKTGDLRICIDPRPLNKALKREHFQLQTLEDVLPELSKARLISTMDLKSGYWHVTLDEESSLLTTFNTPYGRYRWLRLPFGASVSSEIFGKKLYECIHDLEGVLTVADDIMVYGVGDTDEEARTDHDKKLENLLKRCQDVGIRLNPDKLKLRQKSVPFLGHLITREGLKPDPEKVEAILKMPAPTDVTGIQRLNGFVNYLARFLPHLCDILEPIRQLTRKNVPFNWSTAQEKALENVKKAVSQAPVLKYFDPSKEVTIQCDASQSGLGAALLQEGQPIAFASRALTDVETRYAQIEKEMLAIVWSVEKFNQYTYGREVSVLSDHKPLEAIMKKPLANAPKRLQGMLMRLQKYTVHVTYEQGKNMFLADTLSRAYMPNTDGKQVEFEHINAAQFVPVSESRFEALRNATACDEVLLCVKEMILKGWPEEKSEVPAPAHPYFSFRDELTVHDGIIYKGQRVVVPASQRSTIKEKIHSSHLGIDGCLRRARESLFWPNMTTEIREYISRCDICRKYDVSNPKETLMHHDIPDRPWAKIGTDLFTIENKHYLITVDYYSNFWEIDLLQDTEATSVITKLRSHFARYGVPDTVVSDNGPQYSSKEFLKFSQKWDFIHVTSSPGNSKANGKAESAVKTAKRILRKSKETGGDPYLAILDHRNTPSHGLLSSPAQRLMSRRTKTLLPTTSSLLEPKVIDTKHTMRDIHRGQQKQAEYYNTRAKDLPPLEEGEAVRLKPFRLGKKDWDKGKIVKRLDERSYIIETPKGIVRRNRQHIKDCPERNNTPGNECVAQPMITRTEDSVITPTTCPPTPKIKTPTVAPKPPDKTKEQPKSSDISSHTRSGRRIKPINLSWKYQES